MEKQVPKFKLLCVYSRKLNGSAYTAKEKARQKHIVCHNSKDQVVLESKRIRIRHDLAYLHFMEHIYNYWKYIDSYSLFMYNVEKGKDIKIGVWCKASFDETILRQIILEKQELHVLCVGITGPPLI
jgi:deoxyribodipyrimidine photolyase